MTWITEWQHSKDKYNAVLKDGSHYYAIDMPDCVVLVRHPTGKLTLNLPETLNFQPMTKLKKLFDFALSWQFENEASIRTLDGYIRQYETATGKLAARMAERCKTEWKDPAVVDISTKEGCAERKARKAGNADREADKKRTARIYEKAVKIRTMWEEEKSKYS